MIAGWLFFGFIVVHLAHMQEEYRGGFTRKFPPPRLAGTFTDRAFWLINLVLWCAAAFVGVANLMGAPWAFFWIVLWSSLCLWNAVGHGVWSLATRTYQPGLVTGLLYVPVFAIWTWLLTTQKNSDWTAYRSALLIGLGITVTLACLTYLGRRILR